MKKIIAPKKWMPLIGSILLMIIGIIVFVLTIMDCVQRGLTSEPVLSGVGIAITLAVALFVVGIVFVLASWFNEKKALFSKSFLLALGTMTFAVSLILVRNTLSSRLVAIIGIAFIIGGAITIGKAIVYIVEKEKVVSIILAFLVAAVAITLGVLTFVPATKSLISLIIYFAASAFAVAGGVYGLVKAIKTIDKENDKQEVAQIEEKKEEPKAE